MREVILHIYDISNTDNENLNSVVQVLNNVTREINFGGIFHGAIEVYDHEWSYGFCVNGTGVYRVKPRGNSMYQYRESIPLGSTHFTKDEVGGFAVFGARRLRLRFVARFLGFS